MVTKVNACIYLDKEVLENAKRVGLNISKVSENALIEAIGRLGGSKLGNSLNSPALCEGRGRDSNPGARLHRPVG
jgi:hypothetical protein